MATIDQDILAKARAHVHKLLTEELRPGVHYHDWTHTAHVYHQAELLTADGTLSEDQRRVLLLAVLFHDTGFVQSCDDHETYSQKLARAYLTDLEIDEATISEVESIIEATRMEVQPKNLSQQYMCDADLSNLGSDVFEEFAAKLRQEKIDLLGQHHTDEEWRKINIDFLSQHQYYTDAAKSLFAEKKAKHLKKLKSKQKKLNAKATKQEKYKALLERKSVQVMVKTTMRNQIDLTSIADNKANIMLSVNAIIISVGIPVMIDAVRDDKLMTIPALLLLGTCLATMFFATLVTRPIKMTGTTDMSGDHRKASNLFFFGNFFKMDYDSFKEGFVETFNDPETMDNAAFMDLFYLGKSLGNKYARLRICYTIFICGIAVSGAALGVILLLPH